MVATEVRIINYYHNINWGFIWLEIINRDSKMLDILMICHNNEDYFTHIFPTLKSRLDVFSVRWFIYENNSQDKTSNILKKLADTHDNLNIISEITSRYQNKYANICWARNRLTTWYLENIPHNTNIQGIIWLDTNIIFTSQTITELLESMNRNSQGVMFSTFTNYFLDNPKKYHDKKEPKNLFTFPYYYDILAYNYGKYFRTSKSSNLSWEDIILDNYNFTRFKIPEPNINEKLEVEVLTCFGGLVLFKPKIIRNISWKFEKPKSVSNEYIPTAILCEHWSFCDQVRKLGNIYIIKNARAIWFMDSLFKKLDYNSEIKKLLQY